MLKLSSSWRFIALCCSEPPHKLLSTVQNPRPLYQWVLQLEEYSKRLKLRSFATNLLMSDRKGSRQQRSICADKPTFKKRCAPWNLNLSIGLRIKESRSSSLPPTTMKRRPGKSSKTASKTRIPLASSGE